MSPRPESPSIYTGQDAAPAGGSIQKQTKSLRPGVLALVHLGAAAAAVVCGWLWFKLGLRFPPCVFYEVTGFCCLTCGATRAVDAFLHGQLLRSVLLNPVPILIGLFLAWVVGYELLGHIRGRERRFRWGLHAVVGIVAIAAVYCVARNLGLAPVPASLYP